MPHSHQPQQASSLSPPQKRKEYATRIDVELRKLVAKGFFHHHHHVSNSCSRYIDNAKIGTTMKLKKGDHLWQKAIALGPQLCSIAHFLIFTCIKLSRCPRMKGLSFTPSPRLTLSFSLQHIKAALCTKEDIFNPFSNNSTYTTKCLDGLKSIVAAMFWVLNFLRQEYWKPHPLPTFWLERSAAYLTILMHVMLIPFFWVIWTLCWDVCVMSKTWRIEQHTLHTFCWSIAVTDCELSDVFVLNHMYTFVR